MIFHCERRICSRDMWVQFVGLTESTRVNMRIKNVNIRFVFNLRSEKGHGVTYTNQDCNDCTYGDPLEKLTVFPVGSLLN